MCKQPPLDSGARLAYMEEYLSTHRTGKRPKKGALKGNSSWKGCIVLELNE